MRALRPVRFVADDEVDESAVVLTMHAIDTSDDDIEGGTTTSQPDAIEVDNSDDTFVDRKEAQALVAQFALTAQHMQQQEGIGNNYSDRHDKEEEEEVVVPLIRLHEAVSTGNVPLAVDLVGGDEKVDVNGVVPEDPNGLTPLMRACAVTIANQSMVYMLLQHGVDVNRRDRRGRTALMWACELQHAALARILIENGARTEGFSTDGVSCLLIACENNDLKLVRYLIVTGKVNVNELSPTDGLSPLMVAIARENALLCALLLEHGADINLGTAQRWPLSIACESGNVVLVAYLLDKGATINRRIESLNGISCLFQACDRGHMQLAKLLLTRGITVDHVDNDGRSVLSYMCENEGFQHLKQDIVILLISLLLDHGADPLLSDRNGNTPVSFARIHPNTAILELLLSWMRQARRR